MKFIVKVGASKDPSPHYADCSGYNYYGPMSAGDAQKFEAKVRAEWALHDPGEFVYGEPECELIQLHAPEWRPEKFYEWGSAVKAAQNWCYSLGDQAVDKKEEMI